MKRKKMAEDEGTAELSCYMMKVIDDLMAGKKYPAVHTYISTLRSFIRFSGGRDVKLPMQEVFTPGRLKEYESWLMVQRKLSLNTVSTYMRTLQAVYNRWMPLGSGDYNPKLFDDVYTKVESHIKRALTEQQMKRLMYAEAVPISEEQKRILAYFVLMFLFRGMPFIDLAYLRKKDMKGDTIVYRRHKTGKQMTVHIPREAIPLINEFRDKTSQSPYLFPILDAGVCSAWELHRHYQDALHRFNKSLGKLMCLLLPSFKVSSYTARHTWATLAFYMGIPVGIICQSLGHSSVRVTETYLKPFENERIDKANRKLISSVRKCKWENTQSYNKL